MDLGVAGRVDVTPDQQSELQSLINSSEVSGSVATRARIVLWWAQGRSKVEIAALACGAPNLGYGR